MNNTALALLPLALAYIMFTLGAGLKPSDFKVIANHPKAFFIGLVNQVIFVPLVALAVVLVMAPPPAIAFGIMLISFCPGGVTSNIICLPIMPRATWHSQWRSLVSLVCYRSLLCPS